MGPQQLDRSGTRMMPWRGQIELHCNAKYGLALLELALDVDSKLLLITATCV